MNLTELADKKLVVLGLGLNNRELVRFLSTHDLHITVREQKQSVVDEFVAQNPGIEAKVRFEVSKKTFEKLFQFDVIFRSPSMPYLNKYLQKAKKKGVKIYSQTKLFFDLCPARIIGVTGTKGKGTTSTLIHRILSEGYKQGKVYLAGNIGLDPFAFLPDLTIDDLVILELSSFQLQDMEKSPHIAIVLRITPDHLNHHKDMKEYIEAKSQILRHQKEGNFALVFGEESPSKDLLKLSDGQHYLYERYLAKRHSAWVHKEQGTETLFVQVDEIVDSCQIQGRKLMGEHNLENIIPAAIVGCIFEVPINIIQKAIVEYEGLPHRLSHVGTFQNVAFYNDSIATTPESSLMATRAFAGKRVHLIMGGNDKGQKYNHISDEIVQRCVTITIIPGKARKKLLETLKKSILRTRCKCKLILVNDQPIMPIVLSGIHPHLIQGDVVILSPGATSIGTSFLNYKERGDLFATAVIERYGTRV